MYIAVGPGVVMLVEVPEDLKSGDEINLGDDLLLSRGRFRLTRKGEWGNGPGQSPTSVPYFTRERVGGIPEGEASVRFHSLLSI